MAKRSQGSIVVSLGGASLPVYKGVEERETGPRRGAKGVGFPLSFLSPSSFPLLLLKLGKEGVLHPVGVGLLPGAPPPGQPPLPLAPLYTGAGGTSRHNN